MKISRLLFLVTRTAYFNASSLVWVTCVPAFVVALFARKYSVKVAIAMWISARIGLFLMIAALLLSLLIRKMRPNFEWRKAISDYSEWTSLQLSAQVVGAVLFLTVAVAYACLGVTAGWLLTYYTWRIF